MAGQIFGSKLSLSNPKPACPSVRRSSARHRPERCRSLGSPNGVPTGNGGKVKKAPEIPWKMMALYGFIWLYMALYGTNVPPFYWYWIPSGKTNIAMGNHHFEWENSLFLWPCSIANFVCLPEGTMENDENVYQNPLKTVKLMMFKWSPIFLMGGMERSKIA